ncbi:DUF1127 domain-containing protein [Mesorhizobium sp. B2-1-8]|uniref:DUF1127 domain-containing protein n=1 Tax=unclassified Mesorhizobium TaxID=325217 RepID=UPI00112E19C9|nr:MULTISPECIES: DUF1127 domain-containing protein [unclassified Mesorhizobium]MBZ9672185.1 DUF1127 domain-containing protein [Mesorhizobium sp. ES1-3]MBZ9710070.1 DUF1127 domain-containing protein [Mesorhizobium sp. ESP7-2]TPI28073.1 DUF1127 domain-containing protein [Mesorhizobium sp. B3-2-1]UCI20147.1 DUF1127 domain-containing protein [Mesorhizobium sp. B2-1-8]
MTARTASAPAPLPRRQSFPFIIWVRSRLLARWYDRHLQRRDLCEIDDHLLRDLGLTRQDVRRECAKSFWQA